MWACLLGGLAVVQESLDRDLNAGAGMVDLKDSDKAESCNMAGNCGYLVDVRYIDGKVSRDTLSREHGLENSKRRPRGIAYVRIP